MQFKRFQNTIVIRLDKGEEIIQTISKFVSEQNITLGKISGIGACDKITLALYSPSEKKYYTQNFQRDFEITSLIGNISTFKAETYLHCHINLSDNSFQAVGGHLKEGFVSATFEAIIEIIPGQINREFNPEIGLNLLKFD